MDSLLTIFSKSFTKSNFNVIYRSPSSKRYQKKRLIFHVFYFFCKIMFRDNKIYSNRRKDRFRQRFPKSVQQSDQKFKQSPLLFPQLPKKLVNTPNRDNWKNKLLFYAINPKFNVQTCIYILANSEKVTNLHQMNI